MPEHVIGIDPGQRTGYAYAHMDTDRFEFQGSGVLQQRLFALWLADSQGVGTKGGMRYVSSPMFDVLTTESWRPRRINGSMDWIEGDPLLSAQHVGQIRLIADLSGARYVEQQPSQKKVWLASIPQALKDYDLESSEQHDRDARWHLWGYFFTNWFTGTKDPAECLVLP